uniref:TGF-beta family profile domain-containing protein n=1 Tax=Spermophilus dauricus TaxID=99837 RepID=A0A8C9UK93_SPEDA
MFEVVQEHSNRESDLFFLDLQTLRAGDEGWLVLAVTRTWDSVSMWKLRMVRLREAVPAEASRTVQRHSVDPGLAGLLGQRAPRSRQPFMVTFFRASPSPIRAPRAVRPLKRRQPKKTNELPYPNKLPGIFGEGQILVSFSFFLFFSFLRLGWDWVIAPRGYSAYYCEGECSFPLDSCMNATNHAILQSLVHLMKPDAVPKACCAPTKLSATSVLYYDSSNNVILRKHRNMVVKACGCH